MDSMEWLANLETQDLLGIIKYGLRGWNCPSDITVADIYNAIGCDYIQHGNYK